MDADRLILHLKSRELYDDMIKGSRSLKKASIMLQNDDIWNAENTAILLNVLKNWEVDS